MKSLSQDLIRETPKWKTEPLKVGSLTDSRGTAFFVRKPELVMRTYNFPLDVPSFDGKLSTCVSVNRT